MNISDFFLNQTEHVHAMNKAATKYIRSNKSQKTKEDEREIKASSWPNVHAKLRQYCDWDYLTCERLGVSERGESTDCGDEPSSGEIGKGGAPSAGGRACSGGGGVCTSTSSSGDDIGDSGGGGGGRSSPNCRVASSQLCRSCSCRRG